MNRMAFLLIGVVVLVGTVMYMAAASGQADEESAPNLRESKFLPTTAIGN